MTNQINDCFFQSFFDSFCSQIEDFPSSGEIFSDRNACAETNNGIPHTIRTADKQELTGETDSARLLFMVLPGMPGMKVLRRKQTGFEIALNGL